MKAVAGVLALATTLTGCAGLKDMVAPAPALPPARSVSVPSPVLPLAVPPPSVPPPSVPPPPVPSPAAPVPPALSLPPPSLPPPAPPPPVPPAPPPPRVLSPQLQDEDRVQRETQSRIDGTERLIRQIDQRKLVGDQQQNFLTIQSFLVKAKEAISARDVERAFTLADKAYILATDLSRAALR